MVNYLVTLVYEYGRFEKPWNADKIDSGQRDWPGKRVHCKVSWVRIPPPAETQAAPEGGTSLAATIFLIDCCEADIILVVKICVKQISGVGS